MIQDLSFTQTQMAIFQRSKPGQDICGDAYYATETDEYLFMGIADGLGSGAEARHASEKAIECFRLNHELPLEQLCKECNDALHHTRGAVVGMLKIDFTSATLTYIGVGNIQCLIRTPENQITRTFSLPGFLIGRPFKMKKQTLTYKQGSLFMMFSDGLDISRSIMKQVQVLENPKTLIQHMLPPEEENVDDLTILAGQTHPST